METQIENNVVVEAGFAGDTESYPADFRVFLQGELVRRIKANPKYSLRSFAKFLNVESSRLSKMLRGLRPIRAHFVESFGNRIGLKPDAVEYYKALAERRNTNVAETDEKRKYTQLTLDTYEIISDWQHAAILGLLKVDGFRCDEKWIASKLGISVNEANAAIDRLKRVNLITSTENGEWKDTSSGFVTNILGKNTTTSAHRKMQEQILNKAIDCLHNVPIELRDQSSMSMPTTTKRIQLAKDMIKDFRRKLCDFLNAGDEPRDAVYQLSVSLFPLTKLDDQKLEVANNSAATEDLNSEAKKEVYANAGDERE